MGLGGGGGGWGWAGGATCSCTPWDRPPPAACSTRSTRGTGALQTPLGPTELTHGSQVPPDTAWVTAGWHSSDSAEGWWAQPGAAGAQGATGHRSQLQGWGLAVPCTAGVGLGHPSPAPRRPRMLFDIQMHIPSVRRSCTQSLGSSRRQAATHPGGSQATGPCFACCFALSPVDFVSSSRAALRRFICFGLRAPLGKHPLGAALGGGAAPWGHHRGDIGLKGCNPVPSRTGIRLGGCWVTSGSHLLAEPKPAPCRAPLVSAWFPCAVPLSPFGAVSPG